MEGDGNEPPGRWCGEGPQFHLRELRGGDGAGGAGWGGICLQTL